MKLTRVEALEARRLLSAALDNGILTIANNASVRVAVNPNNKSLLNVQAGAAAFSYKIANVKQIRVTGTPGNDHLRGGAFTIPMLIRGGAGKDTITGGSGSDSLFGDGGNDQISGGTGKDLIRGGSGSDELAGSGGNDKLYGETGRNILLGGDGNDVLCASTNSAPDTLDGNQGSDIYDGDQFDSVEVIRSSTSSPFDAPQVKISFDGVANDGYHLERDNYFALGRLTTSGFGDEIDATNLSTPFVYHSLGAFAVVRTGKGDDQITLDYRGDVSSGSGNDTIETGDENDKINAGAGNDRITLHGGRDSVDGGSGADSLQSADKDDSTTSIETFLPRPHTAVLASGVLTIIGDGNIQLWINSTNPTRLVATDGTATYSFPRSSVKRIRITTHELKDRIEALTVAGQTVDIPMIVNSGSGNDTVIAGSASDEINGSSGRDSLLGMAGNDIIDGGPNSDTLEGGDGDDRLSSNDGDYEFDETLIGGPGNDSLVAQSDELPYGAGRMFGGPGDDSFFGDLADIIDYSDTDARVSITLQDDGGSFGGPAGENDSFGFVPYLVTAGDGDMIDITRYTGAAYDHGLFNYHAKGRNVIFKGGQTYDHVQLDHGGTVITGAGSDSINVGDEPANIDAGPDSDYITGGSANDTINAGSGIDYVNGGAGNDLIYGAGGHDTIFGDEGNDTIYGQNGNDSITGGAGNDYLDGGNDNDDFFTDDNERDTLFGGAGSDNALKDDLLDQLNGVEGTLPPNTPRS